VKKFMEWWHSYRLIVHVLAGVRSLLKVAKYNKQLNLATTIRQYDWAVGTTNWVELGPFRKLTIWHLKRTEKMLREFNFAGYRVSDAFTQAMEFQEQQAEAEFAAANPEYAEFTPNGDLAETTDMHDHTEEEHTHG
jgi:hypothetical protein